MMRKYTVIYDACVLYPAIIRDLLMSLACSDLYAARWTEEIHEEWISNLLMKRPDLTRESLMRTKDLMNQAVPDCLVTGYEPLMGMLNLPDHGDHHVLAAAVIARADVIVTYNLKDFPPKCLEPFEIEAQHPDDFILCQIDIHPGLVFKWIKKHRERLKNPPMTIGEYLTMLRGQQLTQTVARLEEFRDLL